MVLPSRRGGVQQKSVKSQSGAFWCVLSKVATRGIKESMILGNGLLRSYLFVVLFQLMDIIEKMLESMLSVVVLKIFYSKLIGVLSLLFPSLFSASKAWDEDI